jgi:hypothetical protein
MAMKAWYTQFTLKMEAAWYSETVVSYDVTAQKTATLILQPYEPQVP